MCEELPVELDRLDKQSEHQTVTGLLGLYTGWIYLAAVSVATVVSMAETNKQHCN